VPTEHRPVVGALATTVPAADPQLAVVVFGALQESDEPPSVHVHVHGPVPDIADAVPLEHRSVEGTVPTATPSASPHLAAMGALQLSDVSDVSQVHVQGPVPDITDAVPPEHKSLVGAVSTGVPSAEPHEAVTLVGALHDSVFASSVQVHVHGPSPETTEDVPTSQRSDDGAIPTANPSAVPHLGAAEYGALHSTKAEEATSLHAQVHVELSRTGVIGSAVKEPAHKFVSGAVADPVPSALPQPSL